MSEIAEIMRRCAAGDVLTQASWGDAMNLRQRIHQYRFAWRRRHGGSSPWDNLKFKLADNDTRIYVVDRMYYVQILRNAGLL
jgi:hypothetical protein